MSIDSKKLFFHCRGCLRNDSKSQLDHFAKAHMVPENNKTLQYYVSSSLAGRRSEEKILPLDYVIKKQTRKTSLQTNEMTIYPTSKFATLATQDTRDITFSKNRSPLCIDTGNTSMAFGETNSINLITL